MPAFPLIASLSASGSIPRRLAVARCSSLVFILAWALATPRLAAPQEPPPREETRYDEMADLVARSLTLTPEYPQPGETVKVQLEIQNRAWHGTPNVTGAFFSDDALRHSPSAAHTRPPARPRPRPGRRGHPPQPRPGGQLRGERDFACGERLA